MKERTRFAILVCCCLAVTACRGAKRAQEDSCPPSTTLAAGATTGGSLVICPDDPEHLRPFLVPFLPGHGIPIAHRRPCMYDFFYLDMDDIASRREHLNEPFSENILLDLAIWPDGTIIWSACDKAMKPSGCRKTTPEARKYFRATLDATEVARHLAQLDRTYWEEAVHSTSAHMPTATAFATGQHRLYILCDLDAMELFGEYTWWANDEIRTYPFGQYSFEDFCRAIPKEYADYLQHYRRLRADLESLIPDTGEEIDPAKTVQWVFTDTPACSGILPD